MFKWNKILIKFVCFTNKKKQRCWVWATQDPFLQKIGVMVRLKVGEAKKNCNSLRKGGVYKITDVALAALLKRGGSTKTKDSTYSTVRRRSLWNKRDGIYQWKNVTLVFLLKIGSALQKIVIRWRKAKNEFYKKRGGIPETNN